MKEQLYLVKTLNKSVLAAHCKTESKSPFSLQFSAFDVEEKDTIQVYDGMTSSQGIRLHSGNGFSANNPPSITLTADSGAMFLMFNSDPLRPAAGWSANFSAGMLLVYSLFTCCDEYL